MSRDEVELIISMVARFPKPSLKQKTSMIELFDGSQSILEDIQCEKNLEAVTIHYCGSGSDCEHIMLHDNLEPGYEDSLEVATFENSGILMWYEGDKE